MTALPYAGTSGWSGSETSRSRAVTADRMGKTGKRQAATIRAIRAAEDRGLTWRELAEQTGWHHGTASGVLSVLHLAGRIYRLAETRDRCKVYAAPEWVQGRATEPHRSSMMGRVGNPREAIVLTERQADVLIEGQPHLINTLTTALAQDIPPREQAEKVVEVIADWLTSYRPEELGDLYCTPLDVTAFILRKGKMSDR